MSSSSLYVSLSSQVAIEQRMRSIANNVANMNTAGFRADEVSFDQYVTREAQRSTHFVVPGQTWLSKHPATFNQTGNPLDFAIEGEGYFAFMRGGEIAYTRDGRMTMSTDGQLLTVNGESFVSTDGGPLILDPEGGAPQLQRDGQLTQNGEAVATIGIFEIPPEARIARVGGSAVMSDLPALPVQDFSRNGVVQGFVEQSNVSPVASMTTLIAINRMFDNITKMVDGNDERDMKVIRELGKTR